MVNVLPFQDTGNNVLSHYAKGSTPASELLQASDGNFYGTTEYGGSGPCPYFGGGGYNGCGTVFQINAKTGAETEIFNFPFDTATDSAPDGAFPTAGLIQGKDGALYGVASDGGVPSGYGCNGEFGCGTLFRISPTGQFTLLHKFCGAFQCTGIDEGAKPMSHLVQAANGILYGVTTQGGESNDGTLFSAATTAGPVNTLHYFLYGAGDGDDPLGALVVGHDGATLYGTTVSGGASNGGLVFSYGAAGYKIIYSFDNVTSAQPMGALIFGADGLLYGTANGGGGGFVYSLSTTDSGFAVDAAFPPGFGSQDALLLGSDGMMYGAVNGNVSEGEYGDLFVYNPTTKAIRGLVQFGTNTGAYPDGALVEGKDNYLHGSNALVGPSNSFGPAEGTLF